MTNIGTAIVVGVGVVVVGLVACCTLTRKRAGEGVVGLLGEHDAPLLDALDELVIRRELRPSPSHAVLLTVD